MQLRLNARMKWHPIIQIPWEHLPLNLDKSKAGQSIELHVKYRREGKQAQLLARGEEKRKVMVVQLILDGLSEEV